MRDGNTTNGHEPATQEPRRDGRFARTWDGEINMKVVLWVVAGTAGIVVFFFLFSWLLYAFLIAQDGQEEASLGPPVALEEENAGVRRLPPEPRLQATPEEDLARMRHEVAELDGYGWIDEMSGLVTIPLDRSIDLVLAQGLVQAAAEPLPEP